MHVLNLCRSMRGNADQLQSGMFSYVPLEERIPSAHPLRAVGELVDSALAEMSKDCDGDGLYAKVGRPSIPPAHPHPPPRPLSPP